VVDVEHRDARPADVEVGVDVVTLVDAQVVNPGTSTAAVRTSSRR
jgi:hypothetical protein